MEKRKHVKILAWLYIFNSALLLLSAVAILFSVTIAGLFSGDLMGIIIGPIAGIFACLILVMLALPGLLAGKGLLEGKSWARVLAMILGVFNFLSFPLGTALCIYTFWVLWSDEADPIFEPGYPSYYE